MMIHILSLALALGSGGEATSTWKNLPSPLWAAAAPPDSIQVQWDAGLARWKWAMAYDERWKILPDLGFGNVNILLRGRRLFFATIPTRYLDLGADTLQTVLGCPASESGGGCSTRSYEFWMDGGFISCVFSGYMYTPHGATILDSIAPDGRKALAWKNIPCIDSAGICVRNSGILLAQGGFRSTDTGRTWKPFPVPNKNGLVSQELATNPIAFEMQKGNRLAISFDLGETWDSSKVIDSELNFMYMECPSPHPVLWAYSRPLGENRYADWYSYDTGRTWLEVEFGTFKCPVDAGAIARKSPWIESGSSLVQASADGFLLLPRPSDGSRRLFRWRDSVWQVIRDSVDAATTGEYGVRVAIRDTTTHASSIQSSADGASWATNWSTESTPFPLRNGGDGDIVAPMYFGVLQRSFDAGRTWATLPKPTYMPSDCKSVRSIDSTALACWTTDSGVGTVQFFLDGSWRHNSYCERACSISDFQPSGIEESGPTSGILATSLGFVHTSTFQKFGSASGPRALVPFRDSLLALDSSGAWLVRGARVKAVSRSDYPASVVAGTWASVGDFPESGLGAGDSTLILVDSSGRFWYRTGASSSGVRRNLSGRPTWSVAGGFLRLEISATTRVRVDLYDLRGRAEVVLQETTIQPGARSFRLPSGTGLRFLRVTLDGMPQPAITVPGLGRE